MKLLIKTVCLALMTILFLGVQACKKKTKEAEAEETIEILDESIEESESELSVEKVKNCDDFIDQYEEWSEEYIAFMSKFKDDPMKAVTSPEYSQMMMKASSWSQEWLSISVSCAQNAKYEKRVQEIADRMDEKMKELGFTD